MNKLKSSKSASKRFTITKNQIKFRRSGRSHNNSKLSSKKKRHLRSSSILENKSISKNIRVSVS